MLDLDAIEARFKAATQGPVKIDERPEDLVVRTSYFEVRGEVTQGCEGIAAFLYYEHCNENDCDRRRAKANAAFVAGAFEDVPALVAEVRRLRELVVGALVAVGHATRGR